MGEGLYRRLKCLKNSFFPPYLFHIDILNYTKIFILLFFNGSIVTRSTVTLDEKQQNKVKVVITFMIYSLMIWLKAIRR